MTTTKPAFDKALPRVTKGQRPNFFDDPSIDQVMTFVVELMTEVMVLRDRQDTLERMLEAKGSVTLEDLRSYIPPTPVEQERTAERTAFVERVLRLHMPDGRQDD